MANGSGGTPSRYNRPFTSGNTSKSKKGKKAKRKKEQRETYKNKIQGGSY